MPKQVRWAVRCLIAFVVLNLIVIGLLLTQRGVIANTIRQANPGWSQSQLDNFTFSIVYGASAVHLIFAAITIWLAFKLRAGLPWARMVLTLVLLVNVAIAIGVFVSPIAGIAQQAINVISALLKLTAIGLLWFPRPSRAFFGQAKRIAS
jgi:hypothetical protein